MKQLDKFLRFWRTNVALKYVPSKFQSALDIGCGEGYLLNLIDCKTRDGIDPLLKSEVVDNNLRLLPGTFPQDIGKKLLLSKYDVVFSLAVFEHLTEAEFSESKYSLPNLLNPKGRLIISVPHPAVDMILDVLMFLRLVAGQSVEQHHAFNPLRIKDFQSDQLKLICHKKFQLGLNNLFVFEKVGT